MTAEVISVPAISESGGEVTIRLTESLAGCLKEGDESVKLVLPSGFAWGDAYENIISGDADCYAYRDPNNARYLYLAVDAASSRRTIVDITAEIVVDETKAKHGDVNVTISGATSVSPTTLTVARYQDFGVDVTAEDATTIVAGQIEQEIGDIVIEELAPGTLVEGRTITLTLPAN
ncbi:MAG: copper amine oxidase N-terminal domain-containing protein, partial [Clostridia bacterium]|nr:copper amine oxidase N-terminal domain-containing protein [Clostridia bacterium]